MKTNLIVLTVVGLGAASAFHVAIRAQPPQSMSVSDGVYTEEQAKRGEALYGERCGSCHGLTLTGKDGPPLAGDIFIANWSGLSVGDLFERTRISMPQDSPGSLSRAENADVVAFVLKFNKYPAGERPLAIEAEALRQIQIVAPR